jgi:hypothetical protein
MDGTKLEKFDYCENEMNHLLIGSILRLKLKGQFCSCLQSDTDKAVQLALLILNDLPIQYYKKDTSKNTGIGGFVSGLFGGQGRKIVESEQQTSLERGGEEGILNVIDTTNGPAICISFEENQQIDIPLRRIGSVSVASDSFLSSQSTSSTIVLYKNVKKKNESPIEHSRIELRVNAMTVEADREEVLEKLRILIDWDKERRKASGENEEEEEDQVGLTLGQRAHKMKYFAEREIELQKTEKDRARRKEKYMKGSGGLKYTAIAMANREMS